MAWQRARALVLRIYAVTGEGGLARDEDLSGHIRQSATAMMAKIAGGFEGDDPDVSLEYFSAADASRAALECHLHVAHEAGSLDPTTFDELLTQARQMEWLIGALRASLTRPRRRSGRPSDPVPRGPRS